jgi:hemolysin III
VIRAALQDNFWGIFSCTIYGTTFITMFTISSVYHGLTPGMSKKVLQVIDHCTIYFLIAGTYSAVVLSAIRPLYPALGWGLFIFEWTLALFAATLTAIDLKRYRVFSMFCYVTMGWSIIVFAPQAISVMGTDSFGFLLAGGIVYTLGAILFAIRKPWFHSIFHIFVVAGSILQFISIYEYIF